MPKIALSSYTIRFKDKRKIGKMNNLINSYASLDNLENVDTFDIIKNYLNRLQHNLSNDHGEKILMRVTNYNTYNRKCDGIIETGIYGYESDLYDIETDTISHRKKVNEAEMLPFYFLISLPKNANEGIILFQRFGKFGIRTVFSRDFRNYFASQVKNFSVEINPLVPETLVKYYIEEGSLKKIRFIKFEIPRDIADALNQSHEEQEGYIELTVAAKRNNQLPGMSIIRDFFEGRRDLNKLIELQDFEYDTIKVELEAGGERRVIDLSDWLKIRAYYDITGDVELNGGGHPYYSSIHKIAMNLHDELFIVIGKHNFLKT